MKKKKAATNFLARGGLGESNNLVLALGSAAVPPGEHAANHSPRQPTGLGITRERMREYGLIGAKVFILLRHQNVYVLVTLELGNTFEKKKRKKEKKKTINQ